MEFSPKKRASTAHALGGDRSTRLHAHALGHAVAVGVKSRLHAVHHQGAKSLGLGDRAILVSQQESLEVHNLLSELGHGGSQRIILGGEKLDLGLEIGQPLLLPLTTLQSRDTVMRILARLIKSVST